MDVRITSHTGGEKNVHGKRGRPWTMSAQRSFTIPGAVCCVPKLSAMIWCCSALADEGGIELTRSLYVGAIFIIKKNLVVAEKNGLHFRTAGRFQKRDRKSCFLSVADVERHDRGLNRCIENDASNMVQWNAWFCAAEQAAKPESTSRPRTPGPQASPRDSVS